MVYRAKQLQIKRKNSGQPTNPSTSVQTVFDNWLEVEKEDEEVLALHPLPVKAIQQSVLSGGSSSSDAPPALEKGSSSSIRRKRQAESSVRESESTNKRVKVEPRIKDEHQTRKRASSSSSSSSSSSRSSSSADAAASSSTSSVSSSSQPIVTVRKQTVDLTEDEPCYRVVLETKRGILRLDSPEDIINFSSRHAKISFEPK
jgi:hypothetical protein